MMGELYAETLRGRRDIRVEYDDGRSTDLPIDRWLNLRDGDETLLSRCAGPTLDVGCGPGRFVTELAARGHVALGIDVTPAAVALTTRSGGSALLRDVFEPVPGTGRWQTVLLADGNLGIGGAPVQLLRRTGVLLAGTGQVIVEVEPPGTGVRQVRARLCSTEGRGEWFDWAAVGWDALQETATSAGFRITDHWTEGDRWLATLTR